MVFLVWSYDWTRPIFFYNWVGIQIIILKAQDILISEKICALYASYIDNLIFIDESKGQIYLKNEDTFGLLEDWIWYYFESINKGNSML